MDERNLKSEKDMKKILQSVTAFIVAFAMIAVPVADAQTRGRAGHAERSGASAPNKPTQTRPGGGASGSHSRPGGNGNHGNARPGGTRPGNNGGVNHRPGGGNQNHGNNRPGGSNNRPGGNNGVSHRPGHDNRPGNHRPGNQPGGNHRPGNGGHGNNYRPGHHRPTPPPPHARPPRPPRPPRHHGVHYHHHVPFFGAYHRPLPPPSWHYRSGGPVFGTILGVALGTAVSVSINSLINSGYTVSSYGDDVVYLQNVPQMNYSWPDAALYYNNGRLYGSQFTYPSAYYDLSRYNNLYNVFTLQYGAPVQMINQGGRMSATWFGAGNRYVTLSFGLNGGSYYTTLSFGN